MPEPEQQSGRIRVADVTLVQLSRGLYRSTATAFKELVSNAWDADAAQVRIDTNYPEFDFISCVDNGSGMSLQQFREYFAHEGIGTCSKRKGGRDETPAGRPMIGRLGIGMMAIGQLCHSFEIQSHYVEDGQGRAYQATIVLEDTHIPDIEEAIRSGGKQLTVGTWRYNEIAYDARKRGFRIYSSDVRKTFMREMKDSVRDKEGRISFKLTQLYNDWYQKASKSVRDQGAYLETIWELMILCPLPYWDGIDDFPVALDAIPPADKNTPEFRRAHEFLQNRQEQLCAYNFRVAFDGIDLKRIVHLPTERGPRSRLYFIEFDNEVFETRLAFSGYLFAQLTAVRPFDLNGVQIRLRNVGIGGYDSTYLRFTEQIDTIRSRWVSGEIFVDIGLERALNIDRDSFNEHDEHFKSLQAEVHKNLSPVFQDIERIAAALRAERREQTERGMREALRGIIRERSGGTLELQQRELDGDQPIVVVDEEKSQIIINTAAKPLRKKKARQVLSAAMVAYHTALRTAKGQVQQREAFYDLLRRILDELV